VARYQRRLSGPLLDRFDLGVAVPPPPTADWFDAPRGENSATVAARVATAVALRPSVEDSPGQPSVRRVFERAIDAYALSGRAVVRLLSVARSIAALDQRTGLVPDDVEEALSFRVALLSPA
jgi:magnesium chelatase family protein